ncbi:hypothetical protein MNB_SM-4-1464 [hydrothermal vent metagenome]|uniref:Right handed beta helix domain-containing protein n=1 Tax=hydrothermal vent metagenome TaxID=652676 RepID=A0A1W1B950_9ZZZZ
MRSILKFSLGIVSLFFVACGGNNNDIAEEEQNTTKILETNIDLTQDLADTQVATSISKTKMQGITPYTTRSIWGSSTVSHFTMNTKHFYVAPLCEGTETEDTICGKTSNNGTKDSPWDFYSVCKAEHNIIPDSVVWMLNGDYSNPENTPDKIIPFNISISGDTNKPIHFRPENGALNGVKINAGITVSGSWVWLWEMEMTFIRQTGEPDRFDETTGLLVEDWRPHTIDPVYYFPTSGYTALSDISTGRIEINFPYLVDNNKVINTRAHKLSEGLSVWSQASNFEGYGNILYDNGWTDMDRGHGHALYQQNGTTMRILSDNIIAGHMGHGMQIYSSVVEKTNNFSIIGNIFFAAREVNGGNGILIGSVDSKNVKFNENFISSYALKYPYLIFEDDLYLNGSKYDENGDKVYQTPLDRECSNNLYYSDYNYYNGQFPLNEIKSYIRPNKYDGRRANLVVLNPNKENVVTIDLGTFARKGDRVMIFNSLDMSTPIEYGTYNGTYTNIHWPNTSWSLVRYVNTPDLDIKKEFWAFVVINLGP